MKLQQFDGGLHTRVKPHLILPNEAVVYTNADSETGVLQPVKDKSATNISVSEYFVKYGAEWVSSSTPTDYLEYRGTLYWTDGIAPKKRKNGVTRNLGIASPTTAPTIAINGAGNLAGTYSYIVTYYNQTDGTESPPSAISVELEVEEQQILVTGIPVSSDPQVTHKRIYRIGGGLTLFTLVDTIANNVTTFSDNLADPDVDGLILESESNYPCPPTAKYLTEAYAIGFVAVGDTLRWSRVGDLNYWPIENEIEFFDAITGITIVSEGLLVFTKFQTWIISGTGSDSFVKYLVSSDQGCLDHYTIARVGGGVVFVSTDGVCSSSGGAVTVETKVKLGKLQLNTVNACVHDEVYYLSVADGSILAIDFRYGQVFKRLELGVTKVANVEDTLYGWKDGALYTLFTSSTPLSFMYVSPVFQEGAYTEEKLYKVFYARSEGQVQLEIWLDGLLLKTEALPTGTTEIKVAQELQRGHAVQFKIYGTGVFYELEYKPIGRQNGR